MTIAQRLDRLIVVAEGQKKAWERCLVKQCFIALRQCGANAFALVLPVPGGGGCYGSAVGAEADENSLVGIAFTNQLSNIEFAFIAH